jgi:surface antigen
MTTGATLASAKVADSVDPSDWEAVRRAVASAPDEASEAAIPWSNPHTGSDGTINASAATVGKSGALCRSLETTISDYRGVRLYRGEACRRADGRWQIVRLAAGDATLS